MSDDSRDISRYFAGATGPIYANRRLSALIANAAEQGIIAGRFAIFTDDGGRTAPGTVEEALPAVREFLAMPLRLAEDGVFLGDDDPRALAAGDLTTAQTAVAIVAGARRLLDDIEAVERAAAAIAREQGVTVRELADAAGITERAAFTRYPRKHEKG